MHTDLTPDRRPAPENRNRGFTLVELMITVAVGAILLAVGMPAFSDFVRTQAVRTASFDVHAMLILARSEAIKRNAEVVATPVTGGWKNGWAVTVTEDGTTTTLATQSAFPSGVTITGPGTAISYGNSGRLVGATVAAFEVGGSGTPRCVAVNLSGLTTSKKGGC